jgi:hypothetical protein
MDHERAGFTLVPTHQDGTALSAFAFDRRISRRFQHGSALGTPSMSGAGTTLSVHRVRAGIAAFQIQTPT